MTDQVDQHRPMVDVDVVVDTDSPAISHATDMDQLLPVLKPVIRALATVIGQHCELVLHDLERPVDHTIVAIENGHVTGRDVGGPSTNLGLEILRNGAIGDDEYDYQTRTSDGRELRSASVYFRGHDGRVIGSLCVNLDLTPYQMAERAVGQLLPQAQTAGSARKETFANDINTVLANLMDDAIAQVGKSVAIMDRADKIEVLRYLDEGGAFYVKRAMDRIARRLGLSRVTAYAYLEQARSNGQP